MLQETEEKDAGKKRKKLEKTVLENDLAHKEPKTLFGTLVDPR